MSDRRQRERIILPNDLDAEQLVLGRVLMEPQRVVELADLLEADDFYRDAHRRIYESMMRIAMKHERVDFVTLSSDLRRVEQLDDVGGAAFLASLVDGVSRGSIESAAGIIRDAAVRRSLVLAWSRIKDIATEAESGAAALLEAEQIIYGLASRSVRNGELVGGPQMATEMYEIWEHIRSDGGISGLAIGLRDVDDLTRGMRPGQVIVVAARPGQGKTSLGLHAARYAATVAGVHVAFFSLEMMREELELRLMASGGRVDSYRLMSQSLPQEDVGKITRAIGDIDESKLWVDDTPARTIIQIRSMCLRLKAQHGIGLVVIDYLGLIKPHKESDSRQQDIASISRSTKELAKELNCPIMLLCQLSRESDKANRRPRLSDLRESGAIEQDADCVIFPYPPAEADGTADIIIGKQRNGPTGTRKVAYVPAQFLFSDLATRHGE